MTVLVVDDSASARLIVVTTLKSLGLSTMLASDGETALDVVRRFHPDAIVTDLEMPGMTGEQMIEALRNSEYPELRDTPVIVCSSKVDANTVSTLSKLHIDSFVPKPVDVKLLARAAVRLYDAMKTRFGLETGHHSLPMKEDLSAKYKEPIRTQVAGRLKSVKEFRPKIG